MNEGPFSFSLILPSDSVSNKASRELSQALIYNTTLQGLSLRYNNIINEGLISLYQTLEINTSLIYR